MEIDEKKRIEYETHNKTTDGKDICLWAGCDRGNYYFGLSLDGKAVGKFAHIEKDKFDQVMKLDFDWKQIINVEYKVLENKAPYGWDFEKGVWMNKPNTYKRLTRLSPEEGE